VISEGGQPAVAEPLAPRHHQGEPLDRELHLRRVVPGDDEGPHRGSHQWQGGSTRRAQGERHLGRLIPAGTGVPKYNTMEAVTDEPEGGAEKVPVPGETPEAVA